MDGLLFTCPSGNRFLGYFCLFTILNNAAINSDVLASLQDHDLTGGRISLSYGNALQTTEECTLIKMVFFLCLFQADIFTYYWHTTSVLFSLRYSSATSCLLSFCDVSFLLA